MEKSYALATAAYNEEKHIGDTIKSVRRAVAHNNPFLGQYGLGNNGLYSLLDIGLLVSSRRYEYIRCIHTFTRYPSKASGVSADSKFVTSLAKPHGGPIDPILTYQHYACPTVQHVRSIVISLPRHSFGTKKRLKDRSMIG